MATAPFKALESRLNSAVQRRLSNTMAVYQGGEPFGILLDRHATDPYGQAVDLAEIKISFPAACAPGLANGSEIALDDVIHTVTGPVQPDASGWLTCSVYPKA